MNIQVIKDVIDKLKKKRKELIKTYGKKSNVVSEVSNAINFLTMRYYVLLSNGNKEGALNCSLMGDEYMFDVINIVENTLLKGKAFHDIFLADINFEHIDVIRREYSFDEENSHEVMCTYRLY